MSQQAQNDYYRDEESMALAYAEAVHEEIHELFAAGADVVQLDEPWMQARLRRPDSTPSRPLTALSKAYKGLRQCIFALVRRIGEAEAQRLLLSP